MDLSNYPIYIAASMRKELLKRANGLKLLFEPDELVHRNELEEFVEIRFDGPILNPQGSTDEFVFIIELLAVAHRRKNEKYAFAGQRLIGRVNEILKDDICIYKIGGEGSEFDGSVVGTMQLINDDLIKSSDFGLTLPDLYQSSTEAHYQMTL